jgi:hypothetical protein
MLIKSWLAEWAQNYETAKIKPMFVIQNAPTGETGQIIEFPGVIIGTNHIFCNLRP